MDGSCSTPQGPVFAVILLHGLMASVHELEPMSTKMRDKFGSAVLVIRPRCREGMKSVRRSVTTQAKDVFKEIESTLKCYNKDPESFPLILIGYSQGGLLACIIANLYKNMKKQLNILGIVTLNAPLMGVSVLQRSPNDVQKFMANAQEGLQTVELPHSISSIKLHMWLNALGLTIIRPQWMPCPFVNGLKDIFPDSTCMKDVHQFLRCSSHDISCLLIASYQTDFRELFKEKNPEHNDAMVALNNVYTKFVTGSEIGQHDTLIPLRSQLCRTASFDELPVITDLNDPVIMSMSGQPNVEGHIYKGICHAENLILIDRDLLVKDNETILLSERVITDLFQFIEKLVQ